ncbi:shikimate dehydrogenase, partial [Pseudomonas aeruginosa]
IQGTGRAWFGGPEVEGGRFLGLHLVVADGRPGLDHVLGQRRHVGGKTGRGGVDDQVERAFDLGETAAVDRGEVEGPFDLIVNGTSASLAGDVPPLAQSVIEPGRTVCYDMMYAKEPTAFNRWAAERGAARTLDGLGMLVEQAAEAFFLWRGVRPA